MTCKLFMFHTVVHIYTYWLARNIPYVFSFLHSWPHCILNTFDTFICHRCIAAANSKEQKREKRAHIYIHIYHWRLEVGWSVPQFYLANNIIYYRITGKSFKIIPAAKCQQNWINPSVQKINLAKKSIDVSQIVLSKLVSKKSHLYIYKYCAMSII